MKKKVAKTTEKTANIISSDTATLSSPVAGRLPRIENLSRTLRNVRQQSNPIPADPAKGEDFEIPEEFKVTAKGEEFLAYDLRGNKRLLLFTTEKNLKKLNESSTWNGDGTFECVSKSFTQLYTIHGEVNSKVVPLVYVLCNEATTKWYVKILRKLLEIKPELKPDRIMCDFEQAFISAVKKVFPLCSITACYFHYGQCLWRHIVSFHLQQLYKDSRAARDFRKLFALVFVPIDDVCKAYDILLHTKLFVDNEGILRGFIDYFEETWIGVKGRRHSRSEPRFNISLWNHYMSVKNDWSRTNNSVEGWHNGFNGKLESSHASLWKLINLLKLEQGITEVVMTQADSGAAPPTKKKRFRDYDLRLKMIVDSYNPEEINEYLKSVANILSF